MRGEAQQLRGFAQPTVVLRMRMARKWKSGQRVRQANRGLGVQMEADEAPQDAWVCMEQLA